MKDKIVRKKAMPAKRLIVCTAVLALIYAGTMALGRLLEEYGAYGIKRTFLLFIILLPIAFMAVLICLYGLEKVFSFLEECAAGQRCKLLVRHSAFFPIVWAVIFLVWIVGFLASYPGVYVIDNVFQIEWFMKDTISAHHPVLHTYLLGGCVSLGQSIFGSYEAGMAIYSVLQMAVLSGIFAYTVKWLSGKLPAILQLACAGLYAVLPCHVISSFTATKDILYAGLFLLLIIKTYEIVTSQDEFFEKPGKMVRYVLLVFLSCCFRNTGIYIFIGTIPVFFSICKKYRKQVIVLALSMLVLWGVFTGPVYRILGVEKGSSAEIMSVPMQQMSWAALSQEEQISSDNMAAIRAYIPDYELYAPRVADPVKDTFNGTLLEEDLGTFLKTWAGVGISCPRAYVEAFLELNLGFWYPQKWYPDPDTYLSFIPYRNADIIQVGDVFEDAVYLERTSYLPALTQFYENYVEDGGFQRIPLLSMLYSPGFYFWLLCFGILYCIYKKNYAMAVPFAMMFLLWLTLMVSPVVVFRYAYPLVVCLPVMFVMMSSTDNPDKIN